jgi:hypothetical protein
VGLTNLGSELEKCVGSCVHRVGVSISFKKNFYRLPFTPPLSSSPYRSFTNPGHTRAMDRITHQRPRQQGYESTSSLRNDSLKHTRKHERRREESNQGTKLPGTGGLSSQVGRTVRKGRVDCPAGYRGLSAPLPRTVRPEPRTVR